MKLILEERFEVELDDGRILEGKIRPLTKKEKKEIEKLTKKDKEIATKINTLARKARRLKAQFDYETDVKNKRKMQDEIFEIEDEVDVLSAELQDLDTKEKVAKKRFEYTVECGKELVEICEKYSYALVMDTILKDVEEKKRKDTAS